MAKKTEGPDASGKRYGNGKPESAGEGPPAAAVPERAAEPSGAQLNVLGQYIKDLSFESPGAPEVLQNPPPNPQLQVTVNVTALGRAPEIFEVMLSLEVHAKSDTGVIYNVELLYGGESRRPRPHHAMVVQVQPGELGVLVVDLHHQRAGRAGGP